MTFCSGNSRHHPVLDALDWLKEHDNCTQRYIRLDNSIPVEGVIQPKWHDIVIKEHQGEKRINRINEEICVMQALRNRLHSKEIWVVGADRYRNPDNDLPQDFDANRENYYRDLGKTTDATAFVSQLRHEMNAALALLNRDMPRNRKVKILSQGKNRISITPFEPREEPVNGFDLLPRLKAVASQKLYCTGDDKPGGYPNLEPVLTRAINWELIIQQYDEMIKYTKALKQGTAEPEAILRRFTKNNVQHPTYKALAELGKAIKIIFLCRYIGSEDLRSEINEGLNVVENWNSANAFIFYGKGGEVATNRLEEQELSVMALHLLQICLVYVNTLMIQQVFHESVWLSRVKAEDFRALTPLIYAHINPYGIFELDMETRLPIEVVA